MMNRMRIPPTLIFLALLALGSRAFAHARLTNPVPRSTNSGITTGPCGTDAHTTPTIYQKGQTVTINWEETIHHTGHFEIWFSSGNDAGLSMGTSPGSTQLYTVPQTFTDSNVPHFYQAQVTLPNVTCADCTIQLVQFNTDPTPTVYYFSCADVQLSATAPIPAPSPSPSPVCTTNTGATSATYTQINSQILQPICLSCHSAAAAATAGGGHDLSSYANVLSFVNTAAPTSSLLYSVTADGAMPMGGTPLTAAQVNMILSWIESGAPNN